MAIDLEWQDERGGVLARYDRPPLTADLIASVPQTSPCLRFIDPWGDTTFNQLQIETLIPELQTLAPIPLPMIEFVSRWRGEAQTYLKFIGD